MHTAAYRLEDQLVKLGRELRQRRYIPGPYHRFFIHEPKRRLISAARFRDRVVHHALCQLMEPLFESTFVRESYANRIGRGTHRALAAAQDYARRFPFVLQLDICQFFPSIDHAILIQQLSRRIHDENVLWLINVILASGSDNVEQESSPSYFEGDDLFAALRPKGLPIGNLTSQFWANVYLNEVDHFVKRELRCFGYVRYVDDLLLFADSTRCLLDWKARLEQRLQRLRLRVHQGACPHPVQEGTPFLGFRIFPACRRLKSRKGLHYRRKLRSLLNLMDGCPEAEAELLASMQGWLNHIRYGDTIGLRRELIGMLPAKLQERIVTSLQQRRG